MALQLAVQEGKMRVVTELLKHHDVNAVDRNGRVALHYAVSNGQFKIVELLLTHTETDVNLQDNDGNTALHYAVDNGRKAIFKLLLDYKAKLTLRDSSGKSTLDVIRGLGEWGWGFLGLAGIEVNKLDRQRRDWERQARQRYEKRLRSRPIEGHWVDSNTPEIQGTRLLDFRS
jgi:hypothetical protein